MPKGFASIFFFKISKPYSNVQKLKGRTIFKTSGRGQKRKYLIIMNGSRKNSNAFLKYVRMFEITETQKRIFGIHKQT